MTCPFLREAQVKFCQAAPMRKLIPLAQCTRPEEKCSSGAHTGCRIFGSRADAAETASGLPAEALGPCPYLRESLMEYCAAAPVARFVPYSESVLSRCGNPGYRYCELYLSMAHPTIGEEEVDGILLPGWLRYSSNHMWLDVADDGSCHAGIDAFLSRALGPVERVSYVWTKGEHRPAAILTASGTNFGVVFPNSFQISACNLYLRANPERLSSEPYTSGWLFEGRSTAETTRDLFQGAEARAWMEQEERHINQFLQEQTAPFAADGGLFSQGVLGRLTAEQGQALFHEFFMAWGGSRERLPGSGKREL